MVSSHLASSSFSTSASTSTRPPPTSSSSSAEDHPLPVLFEATHSLRKVVLNRPKALNSLNDEMVDLIQPQLETFEQSDLANVVLIKSNSKHFCAGGDVVALTKNLDNEKTWKNASEFFKKEYIMNHFLATMSKPVVSIMHGVAFGGGLGLSMHGAFRVATETTQVAMPETKIGLFPDVGANFFLPRLDGQLGIYLALTATPLKGAAAYVAGFTTHFVPSERLERLEQRLAELDATARVEDVDHAISEFAADEDELRRALEGYELVGSVRKALDYVFSRPTAEDMMDALAEIEAGSIDPSKVVVVPSRGGSGSASPAPQEVEARELDKVKRWAGETRRQIELRSPTSVKLAIKAIREGAKLNIEEVLAMDTRIAAACCSPAVHTDFRTGVTEFLIKKIKPEDEKPHWSPPTLADVTPESLQRTFFSSPAPFENPPVPTFNPRTATNKAKGNNTNKGVGQAERLNPLPAYKVHPYAKFGLPTERRIEQVVKGEAKDSGDYALTRREVVERFVKLQPGKVGVREKVEEVLDRRTVVADQDTLRWV
ncbi:hypothetical protein JCM10212_000854 [Sporobolomyces blumeae]